MIKRAIFWGNTKCQIVKLEQEGRLIKIADTRRFWSNWSVVQNINPAIVEFPARRLFGIDGRDEQTEVIMVHQTFDGEQVSKPYGATLAVYDAETERNKRIFLERRHAAFVDNLMTASSVQEIKKLVLAETELMGKLKKNMQPFSGFAGREQREEEL